MQAENYGKIITALDYAQSRPLKNQSYLITEAEMNEIRDALSREGMDEVYIDFVGNNCDGCDGWDGESRRCQCGNRRVMWEGGEGVAW